MTRVAPLALLVAVAIAGCGSSSSSSAPPPLSRDGAVAMQNIRFAPGDVTVKVGQKITWTNRDSVEHNVVADSGASFKSNLFGQNGTYSFTPTKTGKITYECTLHPGMTGTINVIG